jgi:hypothetical protein
MLRLLRLSVLRLPHSVLPLLNPISHGRNNPRRQLDNKVMPGTGCGSTKMYPQPSRNVHCRMIPHFGVFRLGNNRF